MPIAVRFRDTWVPPSLKLMAFLTFQNFFVGVRVSMRLIVNINKYWG